MPARMAPAILALNFLGDNIWSSKKKVLEGEGLLRRRRNRFQIWPGRTEAASEDRGMQGGK